MLSQPIIRHIFLAEDDEDDRLLFCDALSELDSYAVVTQAENGKILMDKLYHEPAPEIIFLDLNMPLQNGYECLREIRKNSTDLRNLRIVALTTDSNKDNIDTAYQLGASYYIVKPANYNALKSVIAKVLKIDWLHEAFQPDRQHFVLSV